MAEKDRADTHQWRPARALRREQLHLQGNHLPKLQKPDDAAGNSPLAAPKAMLPNAEPEPAMDPTTKPATKPGFFSDGESDVTCKYRKHEAKGYTTDCFKLCC